MWAPVQILAGLLLSRLPAKAPGRSAGNDPSVWTTATHMRDETDFWIPGPTPTIVVTWTMNQQTNDLFLFLSLTLF